MSPQMATGFPKLVEIRKKNTTHDLNHEQRPSSLGLSDVMEHVIGQNLNESKESLPLHKPISKRTFINHAEESRLSKLSASVMARQVIKTRNKHYMSLDVS